MAVVAVTTIPAESDGDCPVGSCTQVVGPGMLMCAMHWRIVPAPLRAEVWATYRHDQRNHRADFPSAAYLEAARAAIAAASERST